MRHQCVMDNRWGSGWVRRKSLWPDLEETCAPPAVMNSMFPAWRIPARRRRISPMFSSVNCIVRMEFWEATKEDAESMKNFKSFFWFWFWKFLLLVSVFSSWSVFWGILEVWTDLKFSCLLVWVWQQRFHFSVSLGSKCSESFYPWFMLLNKWMSPIKCMEIYVGNGEICVIQTWNTAYQNVLKSAGVVDCLVSEAAGLSQVMVRVRMGQPERLCSNKNERRWSVQVILMPSNTSPFRFTWPTFLLGVGSC